MFCIFAGMASVMTNRKLHDFVITDQNTRKIARASFSMKLTKNMS